MLSRSARRAVFVIASGRSRKSARISASLLRWRSLFRLRSFPAASRWVCSRMQVKTSRTSRPFGVAYCTPFVASNRQLIMIGQIDQVLIESVLRRERNAVEFQRRHCRRPNASIEICAPLFADAKATRQGLPQNLSIHPNAQRNFLFRCADAPASAARTNFCSRCGSSTSTGRMLPSSSVSSLPIMGRTLCSRAATENRCAP